MSLETHLPLRVAFNTSHLLVALHDFQVVAVSARMAACELEAERGGVCKVGASDLLFARTPGLCKPCIRKAVRAHLRQAWESGGRKGLAITSTREALWLRAIAPARFFNEFCPPGGEWAVRKALNVPELVDMILKPLSSRDLMCASQAIALFRNMVQTSKALRKKAFLHPDPWATDFSSPLPTCGKEAKDSQKGCLMIRTKVHTLADRLRSIQAQRSLLRRGYQTQCPSTTSHNGIIIHLKRELPEVGLSGETMQVCRPPLKSVWIRCNDCRDELRSSPHTFGSNIRRGCEEEPFFSENGITIEDLRREAERIYRAQGHVARSPAATIRCRGMLELPAGAKIDRE